MHENVCSYIMYTSEKWERTKIPTMKIVSKIGSLYPFSDHAYIEVRFMKTS